MQLINPRGPSRGDYTDSKSVEPGSTPGALDLKNFNML